MAGVLARPARRVAAALARRPGFERWIGPDDDVVVAQAMCLAGLAWPGRARWRLPRPVAALARAALAVGTVAGVTAGAAHGARITPRVEPPADAPLLTTGPYAVSRNPVYAGLLVATGAAAVLRRRAEPLLAWAALLAVLNGKARREEVRLAARFGPAYQEYRRRTPRFVGLAGRAAPAPVQPEPPPAPLQPGPPPHPGADSR